MSSSSVATLFLQQCLSFPLLAADYGVQFLYVLFWGAAVLVTLYVVLYFGNEYVNQPRLVQVQAKDKNVWLEVDPHPYKWVWKNFGKCCISSVLITENQI